MTPLEQINHRERQILVASYLYYQLDKNIITDDKFDEYAFDLVELIKKYPEEFKQSEFHDAFTVAPVEKARYGDEMNQRLGRPPV